MTKETKNNALDPEMLSEAIKEQAKDTINSIIGVELRRYLKESIEDDEDDDDKASAAADDSADAVADSTEGGESSTDGAAAAEPDSSDDATAGEEPVVDEPESGDDEWADFDDYKVADGEYDLTGEEDDAKLAKVWRALSDTDEVVVTQQSDGKIELKDNGTGAEYLIDPNAGEGAKEDGDDEPTFEIDESALGYTDNYQSKNPVEGGEPYDAATPNKTNKWDAGAPDGKNKPWAGSSADKGQPYKGSVDEENIFEIDLGECGGINGEIPMEEGATFPDENSMRLNPGNEVHDEPHRRRHNDKEGNMSDGSALNEELKKKLQTIEEENKVLKSSLVKFRKALSEAVVSVSNVGLFANLVIENATSKEEKKNILERFNREAKTVEQGKALYESIKKELQSAKKNNLEIDKQMSINESTAVTINENKIYEGDETINESIDLMKRMGLLS